MLGLASRWGLQGLEPFVAGLARDFLAAASDASKPDAARIDAARQLIDFRKADPRAARDAPRPGHGEDPARPRQPASSAPWPRATRPRSARLLVDSIGPMTPAARRASLRACSRRPTGRAALVIGIEKGKVALSLLSLDQTQALASHPDSKIAERAKACSPGAAGCPTRIARR